MQTIKIIGIIAFVVFLLATIGKYVIKWFLHKWEKGDFVGKILGYVAVGAVVISASCGIVSLFA